MDDTSRQRSHPAQEDAEEGATDEKKVGWLMSFEECAARCHEFGCPAFCFAMMMMVVVGSRRRRPRRPRMRKKWWWWCFFCWMARWRSLSFLIILTA